MIFASDLDQTLIYSLRALGEGFDRTGLVPVESKNGDVLSYMSVQALSLLQEISERMMFIPVTTRTVEQYRRIHVFQDVIRPQYAITSNGGNILIDNQVDPHWNRAMFRKIEQEAVPSEQVLRKFQEIASPEWVIRESFCDDMFYSMLIKREEMPLQAVEQLAAELIPLGWETSVQGRKIYFVPQVVSKSGALEHLAELMGREIVLASGDSLLDRCMLDVATHRIVPRHGELYRQHLHQQTQPPLYPFTNQSGAMAALDILQYAATLVPTSSTAHYQKGGRSL